ncbi:MAG TPA: type VI secretion system lipoprotein TssJ [Acidocella sp.]|nr:type VI secretion system lipoprotein TssJ [Acidocella sp.]
MKKLIAACLLLALTSCGGGAPPPGVVTLTITGSANQNPSSPGDPGNPVPVRIYQLTATGKFQSADVYSLMNNEAPLLGTDEMGASTQLLLSPGQTQTQTINVKPGVTDLGIAVLFQNINQSTWKLVAPVAASGPTKLSVKVDGLTAALGQ